MRMGQGTSTGEHSISLWFCSYGDEITQTSLPLEFHFYLVKMTLNS